MEENINEKEKYRTENHAVEHKSNDIHFRQNIFTHQYINRIQQS